MREWTFGFVMAVGLVAMPNTAPAQTQSGEPAGTEIGHPTMVLHSINYAASSLDVLDEAKARVASVYKVIGVRTGLAGAARIPEAMDETVSTESSSQVRSSSSAIKALIVQASEQSATFRSMVETIDASDSLVYVEEGTCGRGVRACFSGITIADSHRFLWVKVDIRKADWDLMASIGHELRHLIEVLDAPEVTTWAAMFIFYTRQGLIGTAGAFETVAAVRAGEAVRAELREFRRGQLN
jgi:hypothetical protein